MASNNVSSAQNIYLASGGTGTTAPLLPIVLPRDPNVADLGNEAGLFQTGQWWVNSSTTREFYLDGFNSAGGTVTANWVQLASTASGVNQLVDDHGVSAFPTAGGAITIAATAPIDTNTSPNTITVSVGDASTVAKGVVQLDAAAQFPDDASNAKAATPSYVNAKLGAQTVHGVVIGGGGAGSALSATAAGSAGQPLLSQGGANDPVYGTLGVPYGGTGDNSITAFAPVCGGTTNVNPLQSASTGIGTAGFVLTSTGAASLPTWQLAPGNIGFSLINVQTFIASGLYTPYSVGGVTMKYCVIEVQGCGGNGSTLRGGGGGGGYARKVFNAAAIGVSKNVTVAAAGSGGVTSVNTAPAIQATSGADGTAFGGLGGLGSGGDINIPGQTGFNQDASGYGIGGGSFYGSGGNAWTTRNGLGYGGGGGGQNPPAPFGVGSQGIVIITEYCS